MFSIPSNDNDKSITSHNGNIDSVLRLKYVSKYCAGIFVFAIKSLDFRDFPSFFARR